MKGKSKEVILNFPKPTTAIPMVDREHKYINTTTLGKPIYHNFIPFCL